MKHSFNFRSIVLQAHSNARVPVASAADLADYATHKEDYDSVTFDAAGETGLAGIKRKSAEVELPDLSLDTLTDASRVYVLAMLYAAQAKAVKPLVDARQAIDPASFTLDGLAAQWQAAQSNRPGKAATIPTLPDDVLALGQQALSAFWAAVAPKFAPRVTEVVLKAFSYRAIEKAVNPLTEPRLTNFITRLDQFAEAIEADDTLDAATRARLASVASLGQLMASRLFTAKFGAADAVDDSEM